MSLLSLMLILQVVLDNSEQTLLIAHRGGVVDETLIENNLPAIREAIRRGYFMLEVDIRESKDGHLVVHHDEDFKRFYRDPRKVANMRWGEIRKLRSRPGDLRPIDFEEFARACNGKIRLMLDTKGPDHSDAFFQEMVRILKQSNLLDTAFVIGTAQSQRFLRGQASVGRNRTQLRAAIDAGEEVAKRCFLFEHGKDLDEETVRFARTHGVTVVPSVNIFHYDGDGDHMVLARADIHRLRRLGVKYFQIDSAYDRFCREPLSSTSGH